MCIWSPPPTTELQVAFDGLFELCTTHRPLSVAFEPISNDGLDKWTSSWNCIITSSAIKLYLSAYIPFTRLSSALIIFLPSPGMALIVMNSWWWSLLPDPPISFATSPFIHLHLPRILFGLSKWSSGSDCWNIGVGKRFIIEQNREPRFLRDNGEPSASRKPHF